MNTFKYILHSQIRLSISGMTDLLSIIRYSGFLEWIPKPTSSSNLIIFKELKRILLFLIIYIHEE